MIAPACLDEPPCDWLTRQRLARLRLVGGDEGRVDLLVQLATDVIGHVEQCGWGLRERHQRQQQRV
jgi:hypothetical protein